MTRIRSCSGVLVGAVLAAHSLAWAQAPAPAGTPAPERSPAVPLVPVAVTVTTSAGDVTVVADTLEQLDPSNLVIATGNVELVKGSTRLTADRVELNKESGDTVAVGRPIFYDGEDRLTGDRIDYNVKTGTGVVHHGQAHTAPYYRISGERMERLGEGVYDIRRGIFTTCEDDPPSWSFHAGRATADLETAIYGTNASLWVKDVPVVPYLPFFATALRRERQTGFLAPLIGDSSRKGAFAQVPFFWAISDSQDATVTLDVYQKRGVGGNLEYRNYFSAANQLLLTGFYINESLVRGTPNRGWWSLKDSYLIGPGFAFRADINGVSDIALFQDYADTLHYRSAQRVESNVFLTRNFPTWNIVANAFWYRDLTTEQPIALDRLPDIRVEAVRQPIPGFESFLYEVQAQGVRFVREVGSDGTRIDLHPRVSRPINLAGYGAVTPFVGVRATGYDRTVVGSEARDGGVVVETTSDQVRVRGLTEIGADFETRASKIYAVGGLANIDAVLHSIEPRLNYTWVQGTNFTNLPLWTPGVDNLTRSNAFTYSLTNRLRARTVAPEGTEPVRWEAVRLVLFQTVDLDAQPPVRKFGLLTGDLIVDPNRIFRFRATAGYDVYGQGVQTTTTDLSIKYDPVIASIGTRYAVGVPDKVNFLQGGLTAELNRYLVARVLTNWDLRTDTFVENRLAFDVRFDCYAFTLELVSRNRSENEIRFALSLLGVGTPIATGTRFGAGGLGAGTAGSQSQLR